MKSPVGDKIYVVYDPKGRTYRPYVHAGHVTLKMGGKPRPFRRWNDVPQDYVSPMHVVEIDISNAPKKEYTAEEWLHRNDPETP